MKKALFLDRDGVININHGYVSKIENLEFVDGIHDLVARALQKDYILVIVTNQSGIARKYFTEADFHKFMEHMIDDLLQGSRHSISYYFDATHPQINGPSFSRKPNPGMFLDARRDLDIDMSCSLLIGDNMSDIDAGAQAGVSNLYLLGNIFQQGEPRDFTYQIISSLSEVDL